MRDLRKLRSKYEIKLDNRHIAYLLVAELVVVVIFFALGVVVGKGMGQLGRVDAGGMVATTPAPVFEAPPPEAVLTFPEAMPEAEATPEGELTPEAILDATPEEAPMVTPLPGPADLEPATEADPSQVDIGALPQPPKTGDFWTVQVGAYPTQSEAKAMYDKLTGSGNIAMIEAADLGERGTWYRVSVGQYATEAGAKAMSTALRQREGADTWVRYVP